MFGNASNVTLLKKGLLVAAVALSAVASAAPKANAESRAPIPGPDTRVIVTAWYGLKCMGPGNKAKWLDGRTLDGTVGLAPYPHYPFTGAQWRIHNMGNGLIQLECLGLLDGPRWLFGDPNTGTVGLTHFRWAAGNYWSPWAG